MEDFIVSPSLFHFLLRASNDNELQRTTAIPLL